MSKENKTPREIAEQFIEEMKGFGLSYEQMLDVIALVKVKLLLIKASETVDINLLLKLDSEIRAAKEDFKLKHQLDVKTTENPVHDVSTGLTPEEMESFAKSLIPKVPKENRSR